MCQAGVLLLTRYAAMRYAVLLFLLCCTSPAMRSINSVEADVSELLVCDMIYFAEYMVCRNMFLKAHRISGRSAGLTQMLRPRNRATPQSTQLFYFILFFYSRLQVLIP